MQATCFGVDVRFAAIAGTLVGAALALTGAARDDGGSVGGVEGADCDLCSEPRLESR